MVCLWYMKTLHKHTIQLSRKEVVQLYSIIKKGKHNARTIIRARILLRSHKGFGKDVIAAELSINRTTVQDVRDRYRNKENGGLDRALYDAPRSGAPVKIDNTIESHLIAVACSTPPEGYDHWTLELLKERLRRDRDTSVSTVAIWHHLNNRQVKPWREKNVVHT
jgi:transposase